MQQLQSHDDDQARNKQSGKVFDPPVAKRVGRIGLLPGELEAEQRDDRRAGVGQIVKCIGSVGDRPAGRARKQLERKQQTAREQFEENQRISASGDVQVMSSSFVYMDSPYAYEDLVGTWVYDVDPTYPHVLEIREEGGLF